MSSFLSRLQSYIDFLLPGITGYFVGNPLPAHDLLLTRHVGLKRTPLRSKTPLKRTALKRSMKPMNRISAKKRTSDKVYVKSRKAVLERCDYRCEFQIPGVCTGVATTVHHKLKRSQGGNDHNPDLMMGGCWPCHDHIERYPELASQRGWTIRRGESEASHAKI